MTLTDFLLARIAENERAWGVLAVETARVEPPIHGPARALAECEAKRRIVEWARTGERGALHVDGHYVLRLLALPFADHPDYRQEWRP